MRRRQPLFLTLTLALLSLFAPACGGGEEPQRGRLTLTTTIVIEILDEADLDAEMQRTLIRYCNEGADNVVIRAPVGDVPLESYCSFRRQANEAAAKANIRSGIPAIEAYYADNGTYAGMTLEGLHQAYDAGLRGITFGELSATTYCVQSVVGTAAYRKTGPAADLESGVCPGAPVEDAEELANPEEEAADDEAAHNVRTAIPAIEAYYADNETYAGMTVAGLRATYDSGIENVQIVDASAQTYCVESAPGGSVAHKAGPAADIVAGPCQ